MPTKIKKRVKSPDSFWDRENYEFLTNLLGGIHGGNSEYGFSEAEYEILKEGLVVNGIVSPGDLGIYLVTMLFTRKEIPEWCDLLLSRAEGLR